MSGFVYGVLTALTWGLGNIFIKSQVNELSARQLLLIRSVFGAITAFVVYLLMGGRVIFPQFTLIDWLSLFGIVLTGYFGADLLFVYALEDLPLSYAFPIQASYPLIATGLAWVFFGDTVTVWVLLGAVLVITGVSVISSVEPTRADLAKGTRKGRGFILVLISSLGWALSAVLLRGFSAGQNAVTTNLYVALLAVIIFVLVTPPVPAFVRSIRRPQTGVALILAGLFGGTGISNILFIRTIEIAGVSIATILASLAPIFTSFLSVLFLGEKLTPKLTLGTILTVLGVFIISGG